MVYLETWSEISTAARPIFAEFAAGSRNRLVGRECGLRKLHAGYGKVQSPRGLRAGLKGPSVSPGARNLRRADPKPHYGRFTDRARVSAAGGGYLQADAYSVYDAFFKSERGMTEVGC